MEVKEKQKGVQTTMSKKIQESAITRYHGDYRIVVPESITRNLDLKPNDYLLIEFKDNCITISAVQVSKK